MVSIESLTRVKPPGVTVYNNFNQNEAIMNHSMHTHFQELQILHDI